jgi:hypothetical protein
LCVKNVAIFFVQQQTFGELLGLSHRNVNLVIVAELNKNEEWFPPLWKKIIKHALASSPGKGRKPPKKRNDDKRWRKKLFSTRKYVDREKGRFRKVLQV